jgi:hypothetical protein
MDLIGANGDCKGMFTLDVFMGKDLKLYVKPAFWILDLRFWIEDHQESRLIGQSSVVSSIRSRLRRDSPQAIQYLLHQHFFLRRSFARYG